MEEDQNNQPIHLDTDKARAGTTPGVVRWMLAIGLTAVILGMALLWLLQKPNETAIHPAQAVPLLKRHLCLSP